MINIPRLKLASHCAIAVLFCMLFTTLQAQATPVRVVEGNNGIERYAKGLLKLALSKSSKKYEIQDDIQNVSEERVVSMLMDNKMEVVWYATTKDLEERLLPIRICIYRGLLGYRVLMIKKGTQHKFDGINNLADLRRISVGQGRFWADTDVLTANNLNVVKVLKYEGLFYMLDGDRFDAFPRGVHEPWGEMERYPDLALDVEKNLLISYINPFYFFVNKTNTALAEEIERGLRIAIADGSFNEYFLSDPTVKDVMDKANLTSRTLIKLDNPGLPEKTPVDDPSLWFDPYSFNE
jgi:hypothetical protein